MHRKPHAHQDMMDVGFVGHKDAVPRKATLQCHTHDIDHRNQQQGNGNEHLLLAAILWRDGTHQALDAHIGTHITQKKAARIAHEYLQPSDFAKDVEEPEDEQRADNSRIERSYGMVVGEQYGIG